MSLQIRKKNSDSSIAQAIFSIALGVYLLTGAYYGLTYAKWPFFMPPQLDIFGLLIGFFGEQVAGYVGGGLLGVLGLFFAFIGIVSLMKFNAN
jgi:hypothetical protein